MTGIFRTNNPLNTFLLLVYGILLKFVWLLHPQIPVAQNSDGFLYKYIITWIKPYLDAYPKGYFIITFLLLFTQAISLNQLIISRRLMQKPNYLPAMSYLLITSFFSEWNILSAPLIINSILIWVWGRMSNLNNNQHAKSTLYNVGMAIGICSFLFLPSLAFSLLIIFALVITRPIKAAEWLIIFMGILTPWYFLATWLFLNNHLYSFHLTGFGISYPVYQSFTHELAALLLIVMLTVSGFFIVQSTNSKQIVQVRKNWGVILLYLIVTLLIPFINRTFLMEDWILTLVPASAFIGSVFYFPRIKWIPSILQWFIVAFVLYMEYFQK